MRNDFKMVVFKQLTISIKIQNENFLAILVIHSSMAKW